MKIKVKAEDRPRARCGITVAAMHRKAWRSGTRRKERGNPRQNAKQETRQEA